MFNMALDYKRVQRNRGNKFDRKFDYEYIFRFFIENQKRFIRRKIIVEVHQYRNDYFVVNFYATLASKQREIRKRNFSKYKPLTNVGRANRVAATVFAIIAELRSEFPNMSFAFQAATLVDEGSDDNNRRCKSYKSIMSVVTGATNSSWIAFAYNENSYIFVLQKQHKKAKNKILKEYEIIFQNEFHEEQQEFL